MEAKANASSRRGRHSVLATVYFYLPIANSSKEMEVELLPRAFVTVKVTLYFLVEKR